MEVKQQSDPLGREMFHGWDTEFPVLDLIGDMHADTPTYVVITFWVGQQKSYFAQVTF
jgi:hypothetical protein